MEIKYRLRKFFENIFENFIAILIATCIICCFYILIKDFYILIKDVKLNKHNNDSSCYSSYVKISKIENTNNIDKNENYVLSSINYNGKNYLILTNKNFDQVIMILSVEFIKEEDKDENKK